MGVVAGDGTIDYGYEGIFYAARAGARVINCSWGGDGESAYEHDILEYAIGRGCVIVVSAGNVPGAIRYPAAIEGVLSVAASRRGDLAADFTTYGSWVKITAPGVDMLSTIPVDNGIPGYATWQGTSMSAPLVAGVCALVASEFPSLSGRALMDRVVASADPIEGVNTATYAGMLGFGRVNAWRALATEVNGIRLAEVTYVESVGNADGRIQAGESAELRISVTNDLVPAYDVYAEISTTADTVLLPGSFSSYGTVSVGGPFWNQSPLFNLELPLVSERARVIPLTVDFRRGDGRLIGRGTTDVLLDSTFVVVDNGTLALGFAENGSLGYFDYVHGNYLGPGLRIEDRPTNALYHGSFVLASQGLVEDNFYGNSSLSSFDWMATDTLSSIIPSARAPIEGRAVFEDRLSASPMLAHVSASALGWQGASSGFLVLEYNVYNRSLNGWDAAYAGLMLDLDLGSSSRNISGFDVQGDIAYVKHTLPDYPLVGIASVTDPWSAFRVISNRAEIDPPADWSDSRKWEILTGGIQNVPLDTMDLSLVVAAGPFSIASHTGRTIAFALIAGNSLSELRAQADSARQHYAPAKSEPITAQLLKHQRIGFYPNPLPAGEDLKLALPAGQVGSVRLFNVLGQLVADISHFESKTGNVVIGRDVLHGASGLLFYRVESAFGNSIGKLLVLK
jgi:hypothetical protein